MHLKENREKRMIAVDRRIKADLMFLVLVSVVDLPQSEQLENGDGLRCEERSKSMSKSQSN